MLQRRNVFPELEPVSDGEFRKLYATGLARLIATFGVDRLALRFGVHAKTVTNAVAEKGTARADMVHNALQVDASQFTELFARLGFEPCAAPTEVAPDAVALAALAELMSAYARAMADGRRDHRETLRLAVLIRPLLPWLRSIVKQADAVAA